MSQKALGKYDEAGPKTVRLSVNLGQNVAHALRELARRHEVSVTEEVRRAISVAKYLDDHVVAGDRVLVETKDGHIREIVLPS